MKKYMAVIIIAICSVVLAATQIEPVVETSVKKLNDKTLEVTTTTTTVEKVELDRAVLQTELDHIPDRRAEVQKQMDAIDAREVELKDLLAAFK